MRGLIVKKAVQVELDPDVFDAERWELFTSHVDAANAVSEINAAFTQAVNAGYDRGVVEKVTLDVMCKHKNAGAADSESYWVLQDLLAAVFGPEDR